MSLKVMEGGFSRIAVKDMESNRESKREWQQEWGRRKERFGEFLVSDKMSKISVSKLGDNE